MGVVDGRDGIFGMLYGAFIMYLIAALILSRGLRAALNQVGK